MQKKILLMLVIIFALLLAGCPRGAPEQPPQETTTETVTLTYGDEGNEELVTEEREITYPTGADRYQAALEALIAGSETAGYTANISSETKVYGTIRQNDALIVNVSEEFARFGGSVAEIVAVASVVNTLTQFEGIKRVKILVEGEEFIGPSGEPRGFMAPFSTEEPTASTEEVILYFAQPDATAVSPEQRNIIVSPETGIEGRIRLVVEELIRGPEQTNLIRTIPAEARVLGVTVNDNTATINFSEEMQTRHPGGAAGENMTILSIANTVTEFPGIEFVMMQVEGAPMNIEHVVLDAPVERDEEQIKR